MATIRDIPTEFLIRTIELAQGETKNSTYTHYRKSLATLSSASLVCKSWKTLAQPLMWRKVRINGQSGSRFIQASPCFGRFRTEELHIDSRNSMENYNPNTDLNALVLGLREIRTLRVYHIPKWPKDENDEACTWLSSSNLKDLKTLTLHMIFTQSVPALPSANFSLTSLDLGPYIDSPSLVNFLFASCSNSLTSLHLNLAPHLAPTLFKAIHLVATSLETLVVLGHLSGLQRQMSKLRSLRTIDLEFDVKNAPFLDTILLRLPASVTTRKIYVGPYGASQALVALLSFKFQGTNGWERTSSEVTSNSLMKELFTSSSESLTHLRVRMVRRPISSALVDALPLVASSLETLIIEGHVPGLELHISKLTALRTIQIDFIEIHLTSIDATLRALPPSVTSCKISIAIAGEDWTSKNHIHMLSGRPRDATLT
ncbi:hypothetical protein P7C70_g7969, partial [Phenoliferia sp. Uapishka_3]